MTMTPDITLKALGQGLVKYTNTGGNKVFYFLESLRKEGFTIKIGDGSPHGCGGFRFPQLVEFIERAKAAGLTAGFVRPADPAS